VHYSNYLYRKKNQEVDKMIDFSKKGKKTTRIIAAVISILLVIGMVIGLLAAIRGGF
jgi:hypothetical protein